MNSYDYKFRVGTFDTGPMGKIKASSVLKHQIEAGERHMDEGFGVDYNTLKDRGCVFVIVNLAVKIHRPPITDEKITLNTWSKQVKGLKFFRGYEWFDENNEKIIEGVSSFVLVSATEHKLEKPEALGVELPCDNEREIGVENPKKIRLPDGLKEVGRQKVLYSMLDANEHLNNAFYADFGVDFADKNLADNLKELSIDFVKEAVLGDEVVIKTVTENGETYMLGEVNGECCFRLKAK